MKTYLIGLGAITSLLVVSWLIVFTATTYPTAFDMVVGVAVVVPIPFIVGSFVLGLWER